jgi:thymidine kinase
MNRIYSFDKLTQGSHVETSSGTSASASAGNSNSTGSSSSSSSSSGYLELILGPMFSGKTSKLVEIHKQCLFCNIPVVAINYAEDTRYSDTMMSTHDRTMIPCIRGVQLKDMAVDPIHGYAIRAASVILINEGQFFPDIVDYVKKWVDVDNKRVYICALDGDFMRVPMGSIHDLVPLCDKVDKLTSLCSKCRDGTRGIFSFRITNETEQKLIGCSNYIPVCRKCYNELSEKRKLQNSSCDIVE